MAMTVVPTRRCLQPAKTTLVGANFASYPYISAFGAVIRVSRLHLLTKTLMFRYLGLRFMRRDDLPMILATSMARKDQISKHTECGAFIRQFWDIQPWLPFTTTLSDVDLLTHLRVCPCCARTGYHTLLFHLPWIGRCPWHGEHLINSCRRCFRPLITEFTDEILPLQCRCGADLFDRRSAARGDSIIDKKSREWQSRYLKWAGAARDSRQLIAESGVRGLGVYDLAALIDMPLNLRAKCHGGLRSTAQGHLQVLRPRKTADTAQTSEAFIRSMKDLPVAERASVKIPPSLLRPFRSIAQNIVAKLPSRSIFEGDLLRIYPPDDYHHAERPEGCKEGRSAEMTFLPVHQTSHGGILDCTSIDKVIRATAHSVITGAAGSIDGEKAIWMSDPASCTVLAALGRRILLHGYAQGIRTILSRHLAVIYDLPRDKPRPRLPVAMIFLDDQRVTKAHLIWAMAP